MEARPYEHPHTNQTQARAVTYSITPARTWSQRGRSVGPSSADPKYTEAAGGNIVRKKETGLVGKVVRGKK